VYDHPVRNNHNINPCNIASKKGKMSASPSQHASASVAQLPTITSTSHPNVCLESLHAGALPLALEVSSSMSYPARSHLVTWKGAPIWIASVCVGDTYQHRNHQAETVGEWRAQEKWVFHGQLRWVERPACSHQISASLLCHAAAAPARSATPAWRNT
jgi:hypothetical protein